MEGDIEDERQALIEDFDMAADDAKMSFDDLDYYLERLYDWGDTPLSFGWNGKKACWVDTRATP